MMRTFAGTLATLAALAGFVLVVVLAGAGYTLVSTIRVGNEALSTYADELILAWSLQEAHERKLASGRGYLIAPDETIKRELDKAALQRICNRLTANAVHTFFWRWFHRLPTPFTADDLQAGYAYELAFRQFEVSDTRVFDQP